MLDHVHLAGWSLLYCSTAEEIKDHSATPAVHGSHEVCILIVADVIRLDTLSEYIIVPGLIE
jgi:hypothetical protein